MTTAMISYAHFDEGVSFRDRVRVLADRLCADGVDCMIDQYVEGNPPPEGWLNWMLAQLSRDFTLVVCTPTLRRRWEGKEEPHKGLGAAYEGTIVSQEIYNAGMKNARFIPVGFGSLDVVADGRPMPLQPTTYYNVSIETGYQSLLERLLGNPGVTQPPIGVPKVFDEPTTGSKVSSAVKDSADWLFIQTVFCRYMLIEIQNDKTILVKLSVTDPDEVASLNEIQNFGLPKNSAVSFAYGSYGSAVTVKTMISRAVAGSTEFEIALVPAKTHDPHFEPATTTDAGAFSADAIAELRAKLILLGEKLPQDDPRLGLLPALVRGINTSVDVQDPVFPAIRTIFKDDDAFLRCARLAAIYVLCASGTVERVETLELGPISNGRVKVHFVGHRAEKYSNVPPHRMEIQGFCVLN
jgi:hypothetical protein